ncbi:MAG: type VII secretion protein EssC [Lachnospiraceae bacterium]|jgi:S-DNA-T family DNA segregation ATPase FtsK/SpoIIIE|nr:type VII secretion protein EssC [Lachnospiraceae bacterium]
MKTLITYTSDEVVTFPLPFPEELNKTGFMKIHHLYAITKDDVTSINEHDITGNELVSISNNIRAMIFDDIITSYSTIGIDELYLGNNYSDHIKLKKAVFVLYKDKITVIDDTDLYIGGLKVCKGDYSLRYGYCIWAGNVRITPHKDYVDIAGVYVTTLNKSMSVPEYPLEHPIYKRSPRMILREPSETVEFATPPEKEERKKGEVLKLIIPPLTMMAVTVTIGLLIGRGVMMLMMVSMTLTSTVFSVTTSIRDKKERRAKEEKRCGVYNEYLITQGKKLNALEAMQKESLQYHYLSPDEIVKAVDTFSNRVYERHDNDNDFLTLSLGLSIVAASYKIKSPDSRVDVSEDTLSKDMREIVSSYQIIEKMPTIIDLKNAHLGLVGSKADIKKVVSYTLLQLCFFQSYHDMEVMIFVEEDERNEFEWARWLPHLKIKSINMSGLISGENERDQVLGNISQILKKRRQKQDESKQEGRYLPHYIFIIDCPKLVINHSVMEHLQAFDTSLGVSLIYTTNIMENLPENVKTVLRLDGGGKGTLLLNEGTVISRDIDLYSFAHTDLMKTARGLAPLVHVQGVSTQIPESVTFFEMYGVKKPDEVPVLSLWYSNACHKSLSVPLGLRGKDDLVYLNLHERAHGPHGLVAGTTGSGKSEIVQSYILSLAVNFHPHEVGFLLIDYKGGGMANLFSSLPHLLGTITNLDGSESMRALASIKSELKRRQQIFTDNGVNSINQYSKAFRNGTVKEPLPHLFIISDEFAELKKEQPEFMSELVSAARIGRSLGIHLILATQKPTGIVDDQIWSNSKFKLALKVQNESDSNEILKTPDAARITQPGRAYLQVGNNEIYELFQSAYSGATYSEDIVEKGFDNRIYLINRMGQGELLNEDLSDMGAETDGKLSQLDAMVSHLKDIYDNLGVDIVKKPWLPPLSLQILSPHIKASGDVALIDEYDLTVPFGLCDLPDIQSQVEYIHDFFANGNLAILGAAASGKSMALMNMILSLAVKNSPQKLNFYILDYGNAALIPLKTLPHTADYLTFDDGEKLSKLMKLLDEQVKRRKHLFASTNAMNFRMYGQLAAELDDPEIPQIPAIILIIDNYDVVKETGDETENFLARLTRDGTGLGIYTVISTVRPAGIRYSVINNFKDKIVFRLNDASEMAVMAGRSDFQLPDVKGRAYVKMNGTNVMQAYLPAPYTDDMSFIRTVSELIESIASQNSAAAIERIPVLPELLSYRDLEPHIKYDSKEALVGLSIETTKPIYMDLTHSLYLIGGSPQTGKTNVIRIILSQYKKNMCYIFDSRAGELVEYSKRNNMLYAASDVDELITMITKAVKERVKDYEKKKKNKTLSEFVVSMPPTLIVLNDYDGFLTATKAKPPTDLFVSAMDLGFTIIAAGRNIGFDGLAKVFKEKAAKGIVLGKPGEQQLLPSVAQAGYKPTPNIGIFMTGKDVENIKIPYLRIGLSGM